MVWALVAATRAVKSLFEDSVPDSELTPIMVTSEPRER
jgi:hypothetical protein